MARRKTNVKEEAQEVAEEAAVESTEAAPDAEEAAVESTEVAQEVDKYADNAMVARFRKEVWPNQIMFPRRAGNYTLVCPITREAAPYKVAKLPDGLTETVEHPISGVRLRVIFN